MRKARLAAVAAILIVATAQQGCAFLIAAAATALTVAPFVDNSKPNEPPTRPLVDDVILVN